MTVSQAKDVLKAAEFTPGVDSTRGRKNRAEIKEACAVLAKAKAPAPVIPKRATRAQTKTPRTPADVAPRKSKAQREREAKGTTSKS